MDAISDRLKRPGLLGDSRLRSPTGMRICRVSQLERPCQVKIAYGESAALSMSWNKQSSPTMGQSWLDISLLSPTDMESVDVARRDSRRQIILDILLLSPNINCYTLLCLNLKQYFLILSAVPRNYVSFLDVSIRRLSFQSFRRMEILDKIFRHF